MRKVVLQEMDNALIGAYATLNVGGTPVEVYMKVLATGVIMDAHQISTRGRSVYMFARVGRIGQRGIETGYHCAPDEMRHIYALKAIVEAAQDCELYGEDYLTEHPYMDMLELHGVPTAKRMSIMTSKAREAVRIWKEYRLLFPEVPPDNMAIRVEEYINKHIVKP